MNLSHLNVSNFGKKFNAKKFESDLHLQEVDSPTLIGLHLKALDLDRDSEATLNNQELLVW